MKDLDFIETCYQPAGESADWGAALGKALTALVPEAAGVLAASYQLNPAADGRLIQLSGYGGCADAEAGLRASLSYMSTLNQSAQRGRYFRESFGVSRPSLAALGDLSSRHQRILAAHLPWRSPEVWGLFGTLDGSQGFWLSPAADQPMRLSRRRRAPLTRLCEHLAVGYWLRELRGSAAQRPEDAAEAIFSPDGKVLHRGPEAGSPELAGLLVDAVRNMDRARCRRQRRSPEEAAQLWQALVVGQYALVEEVERNGRRLILAVRCRSPRPVLTAREAAVAQCAARGLGNKQIAAQLGIAAGTVGVHLSTALRKLRLPGRRALAGWF